MKEVAASDISARVAELCIRACTVLPPDVVAALESARDREESSLGRDVLSRLLQNAALAADQQIPMCQDTGLAVVFVELGTNVRIGGGDSRRACVMATIGAISASRSSTARWIAGTPETTRRP